MNRILEVDVALLNFVLGSLVPLVVALVTKANASSGVKAVVNVVLSVVVGTGGYLVAHDGKTSVVALLSSAVTAYLASGVTYQNLWKPTGTAPAIEARTAGVGLGGAAPAA